MREGKGALFELHHRALVTSNSGLCCCRLLRRLLLTTRGWHRHLLLLLLLSARRDQSHHGHGRLHDEREHSGARPLPHHDADAAEGRAGERGEPLDVEGEPAERQPEHGLARVPEGEEPLQAPGRDQARRRQVSVELGLGGVEVGFCLRGVTVSYLLPDTGNNASTVFRMHNVIDKR